MKLVSTEIGENWIELTYSDNADLEAAESFLVARVAMEPHHGQPIARNRYAALKKISDFVRGEMEANDLY